MVRPKSLGTPADSVDIKRPMCSDILCASLLDSARHTVLVTPAMLPRWELAACLLVSLGFHFCSFYEVYKVSSGKTLGFSDDVTRRKRVGVSEMEDPRGLLLCCFPPCVHFEPVAAAQGRLS